MDKGWTQTDCWMEKLNEKRKETDLKVQSSPLGRHNYKHCLLSLYCMVQVCLLRAHVQI